MGFIAELFGFGSEPEEPAPIPEAPATEELKKQRLAGVGKGHLGNIFTSPLGVTKDSYKKKSLLGE